jgi:Glycosyl transferases group 1
MIDRSSPRSEKGARIFLFSMRNISRHVSRCSGYEFEDLIRHCDTVDTIAPSRPLDRERTLLKRIKTIFHNDDPLIEGEVRVDREYELFLALCHSTWDLRYVELIQGLRGRCRKTVCIIEELWPSAMPRDLQRLEVLKNFDFIFSMIGPSAALIQQATGQPCYFLPPGVDALRFCPFPRQPARNIDVFNMGRRCESVHEALLERAERGELFYVYDTTSNFAIIDPTEHRGLLANLIKRSQFFLTYPPKFDKPEETGGLQEVSPRFFEGAAGGSIMLGGIPSCLAYDKCFDWPDAVIPAAMDGTDISSLIADLQRQPGRLAQIRRDSVAGSLRRHDWIYRWREILETIGLPHSYGIADREKRLERMAELVEQTCVQTEQKKQYTLGPAQN